MLYIQHRSVNRTRTTAQGLTNKQNTPALGLRRRHCRASGNRKRRDKTRQGQEDICRSGAYRLLRSGVAFSEPAGTARPRNSTIGKRYGMIWNFFTKRRRPTQPRWAPPETDDEKYFWYTPELASAAESGDARAQSILGTAYHEGLGVERNAEKAFHFWLSAALQGHPGAALMVAVTFQTGIVVDIDLVEAAYWSYYCQSAGDDTFAGAIYESVSKKLSDDQRQHLQRMLEHRPPADRENCSSAFAILASHQKSLLRPMQVISPHNCALAMHFTKGWGSERIPSALLAGFLSRRYKGTHTLKPRLLQPSIAAQG